MSFETKYLDNLDEYLAKGAAGSSAPGHLWVKREGASGHYTYTYADGTTSAKPAPAKANVHWLGDKGEAGTKEVAVHHQAGQYLVHKNPSGDKGYMVSHGPSGRTLAGGLKSDHAKAMAEHLHKEAPTALAGMKTGEDVTEHAKTTFDGNKAYGDITTLKNAIRSFKPPAKAERSVARMSEKEIVSEMDAHHDRMAGEGHPQAGNLKGMLQRHPDSKHYKAPPAGHASDKPDGKKLVSSLKTLRAMAKMPQHQGEKAPTGAGGGMPSVIAAANALHQATSAIAERMGKPLAPAGTFTSASHEKALDTAVSGAMKEHAGMSADEHKAAAQKHREAADDAHNDPALYHAHQKMVTAHELAGGEKQGAPKGGAKRAAAAAKSGILGTTQSGKEIHQDGNADTKDWSVGDHNEAFAAHRQASRDMEAQLTPGGIGTPRDPDWDANFAQKQKHDAAWKRHQAAADGMEKHGPVIGNTKSGKSVHGIPDVVREKHAEHKSQGSAWDSYQKYTEAADMHAAAHPGAFTAQDHRDAAEIHHEEAWKHQDKSDQHLRARNKANEGTSVYQQHDAALEHEHQEYNHHLTLASAHYKAAKYAVAKSLENLDDYLEDNMRKGDVMPTNEPAMQMSWNSLLGGSPQGGSVDGLGRNAPGTGRPQSGKCKEQDSDGQIKTAPTPDSDKLSEDDADVDQQMKPHTKPIEKLAQKSMSPAAIRDMTAHERAVLISRLQKSQDVAPEEPELFELAKGGGGHVKRSPYERSSLAVTDEQIADMVAKGGQYGEPTLERPTGVLQKSLTCGCGGSYSAILTACPHCGNGGVAHQFMPGTRALGQSSGTQLSKAGYDPLLRRPARTQDLYVPGPDLAAWVKG